MGTLRRYRYLESTTYPALRRALREGHETLDDRAIERLVSETLPSSTAEHVEDFLGTLQALGRQAAHYPASCKEPLEEPAWGPSG
jgi:hypothetical protein